MKSLYLPAAWVLGLALMAPSAAAAQQQSSGEGAEVYARTCGRCHNPRSPLERSDREWAVIVAHMRVRGNLTGQEERAVRAFLQAANALQVETPGAPIAASTSLAPSLAGPIDSALAARGRSLVQQSGCAACHRVGSATTGTLGPDLNTLFTRRTPEYALQKLANPRFDNANSLMPQLPLTSEDRRAIVEYLRTLGRK